MSGVIKAVKRVFKAVVKVVKKVWKPLLIAAAIYFTAGLALSAMPATASFAAAMPGFAGGGILGAGIGAGATAGTGIFTHLASTLGLSTLGSAGGLVGGALAHGTTVAALTGAGVSAGAVATGAAEAGAAGLISGQAAAVAGNTASALVAGSGEAGGGATATGALGAAGSGAAAPTTMLGKLGASIKGLSLSEKLILAQGGAKVVGAFIAPSQDEIADAQKKWRGAFYGVNADGSGGGVPAPRAAPAATTQQGARNLVHQPQFGPTQAPAPAPTQAPSQFGANAPQQGQPSRSLFAMDSQPIDQFQYGVS